MEMGMSPAETLELVEAANELRAAQMAYHKAQDRLRQAEGKWRQVTWALEPRHGTIPSVVTSPFQPTVLTRTGIGTTIFPQSTSTTIGMGTLMSNVVPLGTGSAA